MGKRRRKWTRKKWYYGLVEKSGGKSGLEKSGIVEHYGLVEKSGLEKSGIVEHYGLVEKSGGQKWVKYLWFSL